MNLTAHTCRRCNAPFCEGTAKQRRFCDTCSPVRRRGTKRNLTDEQAQQQKEYLARYHQDRKCEPVYVAKRKAQAEIYHRRKPIMRLLANARQRAKLFGLPFDIKESDLAIPPFCPVLGIPILRGEGGKTDNSPSIDRLRPERGYVKGNVFIISERENRIKNNGTAEEHRLIAQYMEQR